MCPKYLNELIRCVEIGDIYRAYCYSDKPNIIVLQSLKTEHEYEYTKQMVEEWLTTGKYQLISQVDKFLYV